MVSIGLSPSLSPGRCGRQEPPGDRPVLLPRPALPGEQVSRPLLPQHQAQAAAAAAAGAAAAGADDEEEDGRHAGPGHAELPTPSHCLTPLRRPSNRPPASPQTPSAAALVSPSFPNTQWVFPQDPLFGVVLPCVRIGSPGFGLGLVSVALLNSHTVLSLHIYHSCNALHARCHSHIASVIHSFLK